MSGCEQCFSGLFPVKETNRVTGLPTELMYACLCPAGRARLKQARGIEHVLPQSEVDRLWPSGPARADLHLQQRLAAANIPPACIAWTLDTYAARFGHWEKTGEAITRARTWLATPLAERSDWVLLGPNGTGKTGLAIALLRAGLEAGDSIQFWTVKHLSIVWRASFNRTADGIPTSREVDLLAQITAPDVLVLDEFAGTALTDFVESTITLIVDQRQKLLKPTVLTLNISDADAKEGKAAIQSRLTAIIGPTLSDRLRERAQWLALLGASKRPAWGKEPHATGAVDSR